MLQNLSSTTCILRSTCFGQEPNISIPFFIREYIQAKYNCQAISSVPTGVICLTSHNYLRMIFICLCQFNFSLRVTSMYVTSFTLLIPIAPTFSAQKSHGMGLFGTQHNTHLVLSTFIHLVTMRSRFILFCFVLFLFFERIYITIQMSVYAPYSVFNTTECKREKKLSNSHLAHPQAKYMDTYSIGVILCPPYRSLRHCICFV